MSWTFRRLPILRLCVGTTALLGTACASDPATGIDTSTGSGQVVTKDVAVAAFSRLDVGSAFHATVSFGEREALELRIDDNLADQVDAGVSDGVLRIRLRPGTDVEDATLEATVTARSLSQIGLSGAAHVSLTGQLTAGEVSLSSSGAGRLEGAVQVDRADLTMSGGSRMRLSGRADHVELRESGASFLDATELKTRDLDAELSGASSAAVSATDTISAELSGASSLRYGDSPRFLRRDLSGASSITPLQ
jgi:hypothetical protein